VNELTAKCLRYRPNNRGQQREEQRADVLVEHDVALLTLLRNFKRTSKD